MTSDLPCTPRLGGNAFQHLPLVIDGVPEVVALS